jgi:hypothetical protein
MGAAIRFSFPSYQISVDNPGRVRDYLQMEEKLPLAGVICMIILYLVRVQLLSISV